jgi:2-(1,2-epoxy-1,2-dihydrophenyl)acetyl-CoA isomerase
MRSMTDDEPLATYENVNLTRRGGVATIELARPERMNAWGAPLGRDLLAAVQLVGRDAGVRAVGIRGAGRAFCSGADLRDGFDAAPDGRPDLKTALRERYHPVIVGVRRMDKPVVSIVNGPAVGVGCSLALAGDLVLAAESAYLLLAFVNIGLVPDGGSSLLLPSRIGLARASEMALLGERVDAARALRWGLVNQVHPDADLAGAADALLDRLAAGPTRAYAGAKRALNAAAFAGLDDQLELEAHIQQEAARTEDFAEGVAAFADKRPARFQGR